MRQSVPPLFADIAAAIDDVHGIAVDGEAPGLSPDIQLALIKQVRVGLKRAKDISVAASRWLTRAG